MNAGKCHVVICRPGFEETLSQELQVRHRLLVAGQGRACVLLDDKVSLPELGSMIFARQLLPRAQQISGSSSADMALKVLKWLSTQLLRGNRIQLPWVLHAYAVDQDEALAKVHGVQKELLKIMKQKNPDLLGRFVAIDDDSVKEKSFGLIVQIFAESSDRLWVSIGSAREGLSLHPGGFQRMKKFVGAPSRSAGKLEEAFVAMGMTPKKGQTAVDLGAAPGGWSFVLARYGATVTAVDHGELAESVTKKFKNQISHEPQNGLFYEPPSPVDWMVCDMVLGGEQTVEVLRKWVTNRLTRCFVVNIKLPKANPWSKVGKLVQELDGLSCNYLKIKQLCHDRSEITCMGKIG